MRTASGSSLRSLRTDQSGMIDEDSKVTKCVSAAGSRQAYLDLVESTTCGDGLPCLRDSCEHCGVLNKLVDRLGEECDRRGCTLARCVYESS
jgi:hypothetical protein